MKKTLSLALAMILVLALAACGGTKDEQTANVDLKAFYETIFTDPDNTPAMMDLTESSEMLESVLPGLGAIEVKQLVAVTPMMAQVAADIVLVEVANSKDVDAVKAILQQRIDNQIAGGAFYPATTEVWKNQSEIVVHGNYVCLFALDGKDAVVESFNAQF